MSQAMIFEIHVHGEDRAEIEARALAGWRDYLKDPEAELPWSTDLHIYALDGNLDLLTSLGLDKDTKYYAEVSINWTPA